MLRDSRIEWLERRINTDTLPVVALWLPLGAASLAGVGYANSRSVWLVCVAVILLCALYELRHCKKAGIAIGVSASQYVGLATLGCVLLVSSVAAAAQTTTARWYVPLGEFGFLFAQGFGTVVYVVAKGRCEPDVLQRLERALGTAGIVVCLSVIAAHMGYAMFDWRLGEVIHPWFGIRSFGPFGDSAAWIIAAFVAVWWLRGARGRCALGGVALALTGSIGPLVTLGLIALVLATLDRLRNRKDDFQRLWKKRVFVGLWIGFGMMAASIPLPDFTPCAHPPCTYPRNAGLLTVYNRLFETAGVQTLTSQTSTETSSHISADIYRASADRLGNFLVSIELVKLNWWLGAGYEATSWRFREIPWHAYVPQESILFYEQGRIGFYAINVWVELLVSGGLFGLTIGVWLWQKLVLATYRRMYAGTTAVTESIQPFVWILFAGCMLTADWFLPFSPVFQIVSISVGVAMLHTQNDPSRPSLGMWAAT
ncbi:MAG: hypothetical protein AMS22_04515 [Thiotrichales bacterium SG8_50]|nr:MAG: hypothetical protein AMS22_04515 [Thiotrichales bacterium SG8_50]